MSEQLVERFENEVDERARLSDLALVADRFRLRVQVEVAPQAVSEAFRVHFG